MIIAAVVIASIGILLVLYTFICGLWIHSQGASAKEIAYHGRYAIAAAVVSLVGIGMLFYQMLKG